MATMYPLSALAVTTSKNSSEKVKHDHPFLCLMLAILNQTVLFLMLPHLNFEIGFSTSYHSLQFPSAFLKVCMQQFTEENGIVVFPKSVPLLAFSQSRNAIFKKYFSTIFLKCVIKLSPPTPPQYNPQNFAV